MHVPGIYVDIKGDMTQLDEDMRRARALVRESATGMSNALNNALKPGQISSNINSLVRNLGTLKRHSELTGNEFNNISVDLGDLNKHIKLSEKEFGKLQQRMLQNRASQQADRALKSIARSANLSASEMAMLRLKFGDTEGAMKDFKRAGVSSINAVRERLFSLQTAMAAAGVGMGLQYAVNAFAEMDKGLIAVQKTTNLTDSEIQQLGTDIQQITTELPLTTKELLSIAQSAGQLGIQGSSNILKFTRTVGMLGTASDLHGEEAATTLARLMNVAGESAEQVDILGSVIVALGNNMATTESEIAWMATEIGQATSQFNVSSVQAAALGAALRSLGVRAELGGSAVGRTFRAIDTSIRSGGESLAYLEQITGQTAAQLRKSFAEDATSVFRLFIEGIGNVVASGGSAASALEVFGLKGEEILKVIPTIALRSKELGRALGIAADEQENATALTEEALKAASSFSAQMTIVSNEVDIAAAAIGRELAPHVLEAAQAFGDFVEGHAGEFADWAERAGEGVSSLSDKIGSLYGLYQDMPDEVVGTAGAGILGRMLFGSWKVGGFLAAAHAFGLVVEEAKSVANDLGDEGSLMDGLNQILYSPFAAFGIDGGVYEANWGDSAKLAKDTAELKRAAAIFNRAKLEAETVNVSGNQNISSAVVQSKATVKTPVPTSSKSKDNKKRLSAQKSFNSAYNKLTLEPYDFERKQIEFQRVAWEKAGVDHVQLVEWETIALTELDEKYQQEKERKLSAFNTAYNKAFLDPYILERKAIKEQARVWKEDGADRVKVNKWMTAELAKQDREYSAKAKAEAKKRAEEAKKEARAKLEASDDFFRGMKAGFEDVYEANETFAERGIDIAHDFATSSKSALSDVGFDALTGEMKSFSDYWDSFWRGMARSVTNHLADLAVNKGIEALVSMGGGLFDMAGTFMSNIFHTGNMRLSADEVAAVLQEGEMVIPARQSEAIRQAVGSDGMSKGAFFDSVVDHVSVGRQYSLADRINNSQRDMYGWDMLGVARDSALIGASNAVQNWMTIGRQASFLREQGINISQAAVDNAQRNFALSGFVGSFAPTFAGNLIGAWGSRALGMNDAAFSLDLGLKDLNGFDISPFEISSANIGSIIGSGLGILFGGPAAPVVSGVLSPAFSMAVSGLADVFDVREHETVRDMLEDKLGAIAGRLAFQSFQNSIHAHPLEEGKYAFGLSLTALTAAQMVDLLVDRAERVHGIASLASPVDKALASAHQFGNAYTSAMMGGSEVDQTSIAGAIKEDLGFFGYSARQFAAKRTGVGFEYGGSYYTATGERVDANSWQNPNSVWGRAYAQAMNMDSAWGSAYAQALQNFGSFFNGTSADSWGGLGTYDNYSIGNFGSWINDHVEFAARMQAYAESLGGSVSGSYSGKDFDGRTTGGSGFGQQGGRDGSAHGMGRSKSQGGPGVGAAGTGSHGTGLSFRQGGQVRAGTVARWQENVPGLDGEIFMPKTDGYVMKHEDTRDFINALNAVVAQQKGGGAGGSATGGPMVVKLYIGEQEMAQAVIPGIHEASKNGVRIIHADTLIEGRS